MSLRKVRMKGLMPVQPRRTRFTERFWQSLEQGELSTTRCEGCAHISFPPKPHCPDCGGRKIEWVTLSGHGTLYSLTQIHVAPTMFAADVPYAVAIVDLDEGVRLVTRLLMDNRLMDKGLKDNGMPQLDSSVTLVITEYEDGCLFAAEPD